MHMQFEESSSCGINWMRCLQKTKLVISFRFVITYMQGSITCLVRGHSCFIESIRLCVAAVMDSSLCFCKSFAADGIWCRLLGAMLHSTSSICAVLYFSLLTSSGCLSVTCINQDVRALHVEVWILQQFPAFRARLVFTSLVLLLLMRSLKSARIHMYFST